MNPQKNSEPKFSDLSRTQIFNTTGFIRKPLKGDPTSLCVSALPIIKREVKRRLTRKELCCVQDFELETYIIELALLHSSHFKCNFYSATTTEELILGIVAKLRGDLKFWINGSAIYDQIKQLGEYKPEETENASDLSQNIENTSISYSSLRNHISSFSSQTLFPVNRFMKIPRLPLIVFPMVFQFIKKISPKTPQDIEKVADFYLQNLIYTSLIRAKHHFKIELTNREINNFQKNEKFRRNLKSRPDKAKKITDFSNISHLGPDVIVLFEKFQNFCEEEGMNLSGVFDKFNEMRCIEENTLALCLEYTSKGYLQYITEESPCVERVIQMSGRKLDDSIAFFHYDTSQLYSKEIDYQLVSELECYVWSQGQSPGLSTELMFYKQEDPIGKIASKIIGIYESPEEKLKRSYKYFSKERTEWNPEDYEKFYAAMKIYNNEQLANKKIAKFMGPHIDPNHVRYERQLYNKRMKVENLDKFSNSIDD
ncbi:hypothetical protein SteCoe_2824 [Stentor coeruleus]|uniref:Uncharacterized protein n=1 Tax=Stentor coeruleus TaxID=5963 RepID=A0A1R2CYG9_9CILI|nr:hypothetical protein SteCoe_2824 [Stentor coeruleus]